MLIALFAIQSRGSGRVGRLFGPVMAGWFVVLGLAGIIHLAPKPEILVALNPRYALAYVAHVDGRVAFTVLGSVPVWQERIYAFMVRNAVSALD